MLDLLIFNGKIATVDREFRFFKRLGVKDKKIVLLDNVEGNGDIQAKDSIDLEGKVLLPGFNDSHLHSLDYAEQKSAVDLIGTKSIEEIIEKCKKHHLEKGLYQGWLIGNGWNQNRFTQGSKNMTKHHLDKISKDFPIILTRTCVHMAVVNTKALDLIVNNPNSERYKEYIDTENGILKEGAITLYKKVLKKLGIEDIKKLILLAQEDFLKAGITSVQSADLFSAVPEEDWRDLLQAYDELGKEKKLKVRTYEQCMFFNYDNFEDFVKSGYKTGQGDEYFKIGPLKMIADGSLGARTAYMDEPYNDDSSKRGILILDEEKIRKYFDTAKKYGMQVAIHTIGDGSAKLAIRLLNEKNKDDLSNPMRDGLVHAQITTPEILDEMKKGNITAYIQPVFIDSDMEIAEERVGIKKASTSYAWKSMLDRELLISGGSDAPVVSFNILENIFYAVTRKNIKCQPKEGWFPQEKISLEQGIRLFTINGAYHSHEENFKGSLEIGKVADMTVLDRDIFSVAEDEIKDIKVVMTFVDGELRYQR